VINDAFILRWIMNYAHCCTNRIFTERREFMITLSIRYTIDPNRLNEVKSYVIAELGPIRKSGGQIVGYFLPTEFSGPTNEALGLIEFLNLAEYEKYRKSLAEDPDHKKAAARLEESGAVLAMNRSLMQRVDQQ
jgi:hypothetical protein